MWHGWIMAKFVKLVLQSVIKAAIMQIKVTGGLI
jgi:hypothetical protein